MVRASDGAMALVLRLHRFRRHPAVGGRAARARNAGECWARRSSEGGEGSAIGWKRWPRGPAGPHATFGPRQRWRGRGRRIQDHQNKGVLRAIFRAWMRVWWAKF